MHSLETLKMKKIYIKTLATCQGIVFIFICYFEGYIEELTEKFPEDCQKINVVKTLPKFQYHELPENSKLYGCLPL